MCLSYCIVISVPDNLPYYRHARVAITTAAAISIAAVGHGLLKEQHISHLTLPVSFLPFLASSTLTFYFPPLSSSNFPALLIWTHYAPTEYNSRYTVSHLCQD